MTDVWTSAGVVLALLLIVLTGWQWLDPAVALLVALNISRQGVSLVHRSADGLMDHALTDVEQLAIEDTLHAALAAIDGVRADDLRTRRAAQLRFCDLHLHVPADWTVGRAMRLREDVAGALMRTVPRLQVTIELLPLGEEPLGRSGPVSAA